jgi:hypothetical protein
MNSGPVESLLNRDITRANVSSAAPALIETTREMVDEGTRLLARLLKEAERRTPARPFDTALLLLLRHVVEQLDAVDELFRASCFGPARLQVRSLVEAHMQVLYLTGERTDVQASQPGPRHVDPVPRDPAGKPLRDVSLDSERDRRGRAYLVGELRELAEKAEQLEASVLAARFAAITAGMNVPPGVLDPAVQAGLKAEAAKIRQALSGPEYQAVDAEYLRLRGKGKFDPAWYELWKGPQSVRQLADSVGLIAIYEMFYGGASAVMHATDISGQLGDKKESGGHFVRPLRSVEAAAEVGRQAIIQAISAYTLCNRLLRPTDASLRPFVSRWAQVAASLR